MHVFSLETPGVHELRPGARNRFSGFALDLRAGRVETIVVDSGNGELGRFPVAERSPDLERHLPRVEAAASCRFRFELEVPAIPRDLVFQGVDRAGDRRRLLTFPVERAVRERRRLRRLARKLSRVPLPDPELISVTQGGGDPEAYLRSTIGGLWSLGEYLSATGVDAGGVKSVLDFGCGTGRLLLSWWLEGKRELWGCDVNRRLVHWAQTRLPRRIRVVPNDLDPPLARAGNGFDLIQAVSVFTHLSLERQRLWLNEFLRLLKPGGVLLLTLHGPIYTELFGGAEDAASLERQGYLEGRHGSEGSNPFATFHARWFGRELLGGFEEVTIFPHGWIGGEALLSPLAMLQDVYVARKARDS